MLNPSIQPNPCTDPSCREQHMPAERVALAIALCDARPATCARGRGGRPKLTPLRRQIVELLWVTNRPTGAYELIEALELRNSRSVQPITIYGALEFLTSRGFASRIEGRNALAF